jgi:hypothetical protein
VKTIILAALVAFALWVIFTFVGLAKFEAMWNGVMSRV